MYRKLCVGVLFVFVIAGYSSICSAQQKTINKPTIPTTGATATTKGDLRPMLAKLRSQNKLVQGKNLVLSQGGTPAIKLYATVDNGKVTKWQAVDANGKNLRTSTNTVMRANKPECIVCIYKPNGQTECYEIECKDLPKPKEAMRG